MPVRCPRLGLMDYTASLPADSPPAIKAPSKAEKRVVGRPFKKGEGGRPKGGLSKWSQGQYKVLLGILGADSEKIIRKAVKKALDDEDKDQGMMLKLLIDRLLPATKAVEVSGMVGKEVNISVQIEGVENFNRNVAIEDAEVISES